MPTNPQTGQSSILKDPDFLVLSPEQRSQVFSQIDPEFKSLSPEQQAQFMDAVNQRATITSLATARPDFSQNPPSGVTGPSRRDPAGRKQTSDAMAYSGGFGNQITVADLRKGRQAATQAWGNKTGIGAYNTEDLEDDQPAVKPLTPEEKRYTGVMLGTTLTAPFTGGLNLLPRLALMAGGSALGSSVGQFAGDRKVDPTKTATDATIGAATEGIGSAGGALLKKLASFGMKAEGAQGFQQLASKLRGVPVGVNSPGSVALEIKDIVDHGGGSLPRVVSAYLQRVTKPGASPLTYEESRKFATNATRLSANEMQRLTPLMKAKLGEFTRALQGSEQSAAAGASKDLGDLYTQSMSKYARGAKTEAQAKAIKELLKKYATKAAITGLVGGGAGAAGYKIAHELQR